MRYSFEKFYHLIDHTFNFIKYFTSYIIVRIEMSIVNLK